MVSTENIGTVVWMKNGFSNRFLGEADKASSVFLSFKLNNKHRSAQAPIRFAAPGPALGGRGLTWCSDPVRPGSVQIDTARCRGVAVTEALQNSQPEDGFVGVVFVIVIDLVELKIRAPTWLPCSAELLKTSLWLVEVNDFAVRIDRDTSDIVRISVARMYHLGCAVWARDIHRPVPRYRSAQSGGSRGGDE
jgi:hypothetical protein